MKYEEFFSCTNLNDILSQNEKDLIIDGSTQVTYSKGDCLVKKGEFVTNAVFIWTGYVKVHMELKMKNMIINVLGSQRFVLLDYMVIYDFQPFNITAIEETSVLFIDVNLLRELAQKNQLFSYYLLKFSTKANFDYFTQNFLSLVQNNIHGRLANILLYLSESVFQSTSFDILLTRKELSEFGNISRENVIKVLYEFDNDGIIQLRGKSIHIHSIENLRRIAFHG